VRIVVFGRALGITGVVSEGAGDYRGEESRSFPE
jgi:hypothetical protein